MTEREREKVITIMNIKTSHVERKQECLRENEREKERQTERQTDYCLSLSRCVRLI